LCQPNLSLAELPDNLLRRELLPSCHLSTSLGLQPPEILSLEVATFKGGRSAAARRIGPDSCRSRSDGGGRFPWSHGQRVLEWERTAKLRAAHPRWIVLPSIVTSSSASSVIRPALRS
jgi:hypothetical protein